ncbi:MAG TPA: rhomboid family intramembrane serine protease [Deltaproteobacteria bacterium]|nr:rhomboid family intramembrane serine protease [Deltaproteobacteria bacterium]
MLPFTTSVRTSRLPIVTILLLGACLLVFSFELSLRSDELAALFDALGVVPRRFLQAGWGQLHLWLVPIYTSVLLHGGFAHIIGNMIFLWVFGGPVESRLGHVRYALLLALAAAAAATTHAWMNPSSMVPTVGASGAVAGVLGAYLALYPLSRVVIVVPIFLLPLFFEVPALLFIGFWVLQNLFSGAVDQLVPSAAGVAWWAHVGGYLAGSFFVRILARRDHFGHRPGHYNHPRYRVRRHRY